MKWFTALKYLVLATPFLVSGCGGSSSDSDPEVVASETGVFVDSVVGGIDYRTATLTGRTNAAGEYDYAAGETVIFSVGDFDFPPVAAGEIITPLDIFQTEDINNTAVLNLARLLQSLDADGDPGNGITISEMAHTSAAGLSANFSSASFEADVTNLVANSGSVNSSLISASAALAHLQETLAEFGLLTSLVGSWYTEGDNRTLITFISDTEYFVTQDIDDTGEPNCSDGMEKGSYTWDSTSGAFSLTNQIDTTGDCGLTSVQGVTYEATITINGNTLTLTDEEGSGSLARVVDDSNELIGGWSIFGNNATLVTFIDDTRYFVAQDIGPGEPSCMDGMESGTYAWNTETNSLVFTNLIDTTDDCGLTEVEGGTYTTVGVVGDGTLTVDEGENQFTLTAVR